MSKHRDGTHQNGRESNSLRWKLSGLVAGDFAICGRLAALILQLWLAGLRFGEFITRVVPAEPLLSERRVLCMANWSEGLW